MLLARPRHCAVSSPAAAVMRAGSAVSSEVGPCAVSPARREVQLETLEAELRDAVEDSSRPQSTLETPMCRASPQPCARTGHGKGQRHKAVIGIRPDMTQRSAYQRGKVKYEWREHSGLSLTEKGDGVENSRGKPHSRSLVGRRRKLRQRAGRNGKENQLINMCKLQRKQPLRGN